jgi:hypothetical protein
MELKEFKKGVISSLANGICFYYQIQGHDCGISTKTTKKEAKKEAARKAVEWVLRESANLVPRRGLVLLSKS